MILPDNEETRKRAGEAIAQGGVIAFRTDTFYGLGADPFNPRAVALLKNLKGRLEGKPILLLISSLEQLDRVIRNRSKLFEILAQKLWPGPLTLIGDAVAQLPTEITANTGTVGVRFPDDHEVRSLVSSCGGLLTATSANPAGAEPARSADEVMNYFPEGLNLIVNGGYVTATLPSTVLDVSTNSPQMIREGATPREVIDKVLASR